MRNNLLVLFFLASFFSVTTLKSATCISLGSGNWNTAANWSCGSVPTCGDSIVILATHIVTISTQQNYTGCGSPMKITIYGRLYFISGNKLRLPCNSAVYVMSGGQIQSSGGGGNSNTIEICSDVYWNTGMGNLTGPACLPPSQPGCANVLPVELVSFSGTVCNTNAVCLNWETATEKNNDYFDVQRSDDLSAFTSIFQVKSKVESGNSSIALKYDATDKEPLSGVSYYRLKQVDKDFSYTFSKVVAVNLIKEKNVRFVVYPNPNYGEFTADISGLENNHAVKIVLRDIKGQTVFESSFSTTEVNTKVQITPQNKISSGVYICSLYLEEIEYKVKVIVNG